MLHIPYKYFFAKDGEKSLQIKYLFFFFAGSISIKFMHVFYTHLRNYSFSVEFA